MAEAPTDAAERMDAGEISEQALDVVARSARRAIRLARVLTFVGASDRRYRSLHVSGLLLALSGVASVILVASLGAADVADIVALRVVAYSCWLYGGFGLSTLLKTENSPGDAVQRLIEMRGQGQTPWYFQALGIAGRLSLGMCFAGLPAILTAVALSQNAQALGQRVLLLFLSGAYLVSLGCVLGAIAVFCRKAAPERPRTLALAIVLVPFLFSLLNDNIPSVVGAYSWMLRQMIALGGQGA